MCEYKGLRGGLCDLIPRSLLVFRFYLNSEERSLVDVGIVCRTTLILACFLFLVIVFLSLFGVCFYSVARKIPTSGIRA